MRKYVAEAVGTFALVFAGTGAIVVDDLTHALSHVGVALTFGLVVMVMIYALGDVSGAHLNPAVTLGFYLARLLPGRSVGSYIAAQLIGAFAASGSLLAMFGNRASLGATFPANGAGQSFWLEVLLTGLLMLVISQCIHRAQGTRRDGGNRRGRGDCHGSDVWRAHQRCVDESGAIAGTGGGIGEFDGGVGLYCSAAIGGGGGGSVMEDSAACLPATRRARVDRPKADSEQRRLRRNSERWDGVLAVAF